nr:S100P-binding protein isoform X1 [Pogona vitticeps]
MAGNPSHPYSYNIKITVLNNSVSRSSSPLGETEEREQPERKRGCYTQGSGSSPPHRSSISNGIASFPFASSTASDDSDIDDSLLDSPGGGNPDSPTGLSREDEDRLLFDNLVDDLETSSDEVRLGLGFQRVESSEGFASLKFRQLPKALKGAVSTEPSRPTVRSFHEERFGPPGGGSDLSKEDSQAGSGLGCGRPLLPDAVRVADALLNLQKEGDLSGRREKGAAQTVEEESGQEEGPSKSQASVNELLLRGKRTSSVLQSTEGASHSSSSQCKGAPSTSSSVGDQRKICIENPPAPEPKRPRRVYIEEKDLEERKEKYIRAVLAHARSRPVISEVNELHALIQCVASENQEYRRQHTTDLTERNYVWRSNRTNQKFSLPEWVEKNGRKVCRFATVPDRFQRCPVPS